MPDDPSTSNGQAPEQLEGVVDKIVYENEANGFFVARLKVEKSPVPVSFVGNLMAVSEGETVRLWGQWQEDKRFGRQFKVERYETIQPATAEAIERYLGSGLIAGIGKVYAKRLVEAFGRATLQIIDEQPQRLRQVEGIGEKRAAQIRAAWERQKAVQSIMLFLQGHGIGTNQAIKIYKRYGDAAVAFLRENPYRLAHDIVGISFTIADKIAASLGIHAEAPQRLEAGLLHVLDTARVSGHCFLPEDELVPVAVSLLNVSASLVQPALNLLASTRLAVREGESVYLRHMYEDERGAARILAALAAGEGKTVLVDVERAIQWVEMRQRIALSPEQREAVAKAVDSKVLVVTGGPGTGKTTIVRSLLDILEKKGLHIELAAPTGRAAKRMEAATGREARTIHRLLEFSPKEGGFLRNAENPLDLDLLVVDECSMVDISLAHQLLSALPASARLFLVGDVDQLPSVGPGNVLMDIIASETVPTVWLKTIFRQAEESGIITNAHRINRGLYPEFNTTDFFFVERKDPTRALETVVELVAERIPERYAMDPLRDIQVLAPMHRGDAGVSALNAALQERLNPAGQPVPRRVFRAGDKVMQLRNNYELDVYNGDVGVVQGIDEEAQEVRVAFDDRIVVYPLEELDDVGLAYAATVHKSQGSEYRAVVIPLLTQHYLMLQRNVLYTAVTRGKELVVLVGEPKALRRAIQNTEQTRRHTRLAERLRGLSFK
jgi:exodeoxyribonuclease V alpha subunit